MNQTAVDHGGRAAGAGEWGDFVTVEEAAALLRISRSTAWRWVKAGVLRAYRMGGRRVWLRKSELAGLVKPAIGSTAPAGRTVRGGPVRDRRLTEAERQQMLEAVEAAGELRARLLDGRDGRLFRPAYEDIDEAREERSAARG